MNIKIPGQNKIITQSNDSSLLGNIVESFNLDLRSDIGKIRVTKTKKVGDFAKSSIGTTQGVISINQNNGIPFFFGVESSLDGIFTGDGSTFFSSNFTRDSSSVTPDSGASDITLNNGYVYASASGSVFYSAQSSFGIWTEISSPALDSSSPHLFTTLGSKTYITNLDYKIGSINSSNVLSLTGTATLNLEQPGYTITALMSGLDRIWIGLSSLQQGQFGTTYVYEWDGKSENTYSQIYEIDASGIICGVIKDGIPYVLDTNGRLLVYSGSRFTEVARLPYKQGELMYGFNTNQFNNRAIHPRAITVDNDEILINVSNLLHGSSTTEKYFAEFPSGVWAYHPDHGLYHKYSAANQDKDETGSTNLSSYGEQVVGQAGAIFVHDPIVSMNATGQGGRVVFSQRYFTGSDNDTETGDIDVTYKTAIFASDTDDNTQKFGYFVTPEIHTDNVTDVWNKVYTTYKKLLDSADEIIVKYRTEKKPKTLADVAWINSKTIITSTDISAYQQGDEVQFIQGNGSGFSAHIVSITSNGSSYTVILDSEFDNGTGTALAYFENWTLAGRVTYTDTDQVKAFTLATKNVSPMVQVKVAMKFTGENELYSVVIKSKNTITE